MDNWHRYNYNIINNNNTNYNQNEEFPRDYIDI